MISFVTTSKKKLYLIIGPISLSLLAFIPLASANQTPSLPQLPGGIAALPGGVSAAPGGATTMGGTVTLTEDQIKSLPEEQQKLVREALEKAKAAAGAAPSASGTPSVDLGAVANQAQGLLSSLLKNLKPEQQKMLEEAQKSGKLPAGFAEMLTKGATDPAVLAKLTPEQRDVLQKAITSGEFSAEAIKDLVGEVDLATVKEVAKSVAENKPIDINKVKDVVTKVAKLVCTNGKKKITVNAKRCPAGFKKG